MKLKIVNIKRFIISISMILGIIMGASMIFSNITLSHGEIEFKKVSVISGDTLWTIAKEEQKYNKYYEDKDVRDIIYDIQKTNNLNSNNLYEGQTLSIPKI